MSQNNQNNSSAPNSLFARKLSDLENRGYEVTGRILHKDGEYALFDGSCRWLTQPQYQRLMHEQDGSLFASQPPADRVQGGLTDEQIIQIKTECGWRYNSLWDLSDSGACEFARAILSRQSMMGGEAQTPNNEDFSALWDKHGGHPADFAADVLERWGGWPAGVLGQGGSASLAAPQEQAERPSHETIISEGGKLVCTACGTTTPANAAAANGDGLPSGLTFDGYHDSDEHYGKTILDLVRSRLDIDPTDLQAGDVFYVSACWTQPQEWRVVRSGNPFEVERISPPIHQPAPQTSGKEGEEA